MQSQYCQLIPEDCFLIRWDKSGSGMQSTTTNTTLAQHAGAVPSLCALCCLRKRAKIVVPVKHETKQNGWLFWRIEVVLLVPKGKKSLLKWKLVNTLVWVQPFSAIKSWMNHGYTDFLAVGSEYQCYTSRYPKLTSGEAVSLHAQRWEVSQRFLCPHT